MPIEQGRTTRRKRVTLPSGGTVDVPVITSISFIDPNDRYQETVFTIDNSSQGDRIVTVEDVKGIQVERITRFKVIDANDRYQEIWFDVDNLTRSDHPPPYFITHLRSHVVRYRGQGNDYIDSELIDEFTMLDPTDRYQETRYTLLQPQTDDEAQADPSDPIINDTANGVDPPYRTDPFQNLVDLSQGDYIETYIDFDYGWTNPHPRVGYIPPSPHSGLGCDPALFTPCGGASGSATGANGGMDTFYLRVRPRIMPGWTTANFPTEADIPFSLPDLTDVFDSGTAAGVIAARANRETSTAGNALSPEDAAKYPNYSAIFDFSFEEWLPLADSGYFCQDGTGDEIPWKTPYTDEYTPGPHSYDLTGATITDDSTAPTTYEIIGTQNTLPYSLYRETPLPWNTLTRNGNPARYPIPDGPVPPLLPLAVHTQYYYPNIIPFGFCRVEDIYCFSREVQYPNQLDHTQPGIAWIPWWRVYCLFKVQSA